MKQPILSAALDVGARNDYAANGGEIWLSYGGGPTTLAQGDASPNTVFPKATACTGIIFTRSRFTFTDVTDGLSNTYMVGEKYVNPDAYATGTDYGDDQGPYVSDDRDVVRSAAGGSDSGSFWPPIQDRSGFGCTTNFGSAHSTGFHMAFCDSSVRPINYSIAENIHRRLCNRRDGLSLVGFNF